jgi:starch synthase
MALTLLPGELFGPDGLEFWGDLCLLKAGLVAADRIVTVSPRYAREVQSEAFGEGLHGLYAARADALSGIANGIDAERYDPATDAALPASYGAAEPAGKAVCRAALCGELGLDEPEPGLLCTAIGRLAWQKGWDVLADAALGLIEAGAVLALLGDGDPSLAQRLADAARRHPRRVALHTGWDEPLSRRMYAAADTVLVPSRFEPCGLVQLIAQRYGTLPVAHAVGGLVDTIEDGRTGVLFAPLDAPSLVDATRRAARLRTQRGDAELSTALMELDVSWAAPAKRWEALLRDASRTRARASREVS